MLRELLGRFRFDLGIDLGTANTLIGVAGEGLVLNEPSVVAIEQPTRRVLSGGCAVGHLARQMEGRTPDSIAVVRPLSDGVIADFTLCEAMLRYFLKKSQPPGWRRRPRVLVSVPGCITPVERRAVYGSLLRAGAREVLLLDESKAAAIGAGLPVVEPVASMVCDIGGGTTEVAVLSLAQTVARQSIRVGGDRMDQALSGFVRRHYGLKIGLPAAERLRIEIGSAWPLDEERSAETSGVDAISGLPRRVALASEEVRQALGEPLEAIIEAIKATLDGCPPDLAADLMDQGIVLCGGGSLLAGVDRFVTEQTGIPARVDPEPLSTVARGLLVCLENFDRWRPAMESGRETT